MLIITGGLYIPPTDLSQFLADFHALSVATRQCERGDLLGSADKHSSGAMPDAGSFALGHKQS